MLGSLLDYWDSFRWQKRNKKIPKNIINIPLKGTTSQNKWIYFAPETNYNCLYLKKRLFPQKNNIDIYLIPRSIVQSDPKITKKALENILNKAVTKQIKKFGSKKINVLGVSIGNVLAYKFATYFPVNKLISVVPGSRLPECIWESIATNKVARKSTLKNYQKELSCFNPIDSLNNIKVKSIEIYLGRYDKMIPYARGKELLDKIKKQHFNYKSKIYPFSGHIESIYYFANKFNKQFKK